MRRSYTPPVHLFVQTSALGELGLDWKLFGARPAPISNGDLVDALEGALVSVEALCDTCEALAAAAGGAGALAAAVMRGDVPTSQDRASVDRLIAETVPRVLLTVTVERKRFIELRRRVTTLRRPRLVKER